MDESCRIAFSYAAGLFLVFLGIVFLLYFLPTIVALCRGHHNFAAIAALNFFLGWTFLGWVIAMVWALTQVNNRDHWRYHASQYV